MKRSQAEAIYDRGRELVVEALVQADRQAEKLALQSETAPVLDLRLRRARTRQALWSTALAALYVSVIGGEVWLVLTPTVTATGPFAAVVFVQLSLIGACVGAAFHVLRPIRQQIRDYEDALAGSLAREQPDGGFLRVPTRDIAPWLALASSVIATACSLVVSIAVRT